MAAARALVLIAALWAGLAHPAEFKVAVAAQDRAQVAQPAGPVPAGMPGADLAAVNDDFAREICRRLNARCTLLSVPLADILPGVEARRYDLGFGNFLRTPERDRHVAFSSPIWQSSSRLVGLRANAAEDGPPVSLDSLRGARVVAIAGSQQQAFLEAIAASRGLSVLAVATPSGAFDALREGRAEFALLPVLTAFALLRQGGEGNFEFVGPAVADRGLGGGVHIAVPRGKDKLRREVDEAIAAIRADGTFQRIVRRYFPLGLD